MVSTDTKKPSLISRALNRPWLQRATQKSVRIRQADEALMMADRAAGLAEDRRTNKNYHEQQERVVKATVDKYVKRNGATTMPEDEDAVQVDLGDRYEEHTHLHGPQRGASSGVLGKVLPWVLATAMGPLGMAAAAWWLGSDKESLNVKDVQSKFKIEVYDESGTLIETLPYSELPKK